MKQVKILTVNGESYQITDPAAARIDDEASDLETTWSGAKLASVVGNVEEALACVLQIQNALIGGGVQ